MDCIEIFSGVGGMALGLGAAGFRHIDVVDSDESCIETINRNAKIGNFPLAMSHATLLDIRDYDFRPLEGKLTLLSGGPPCQPFSLGGSHRAALDTRNMFPQAIRAVREARPRAFLFENVPGILRPKFRNYFEYVRLSLSYPDLTQCIDEDWEEHLRRLECHHTSNGRSARDYRVIAQAMNSADFGVPQRRTRVFLIGIRSDLKIGWNFPEPTHSAAALSYTKSTSEYYDRHGICPTENDCQDKLNKTSIEPSSDQKPWVTLRDAICDLPNPENHSVAKGISGHKFKPGARSYKGHTGSELDLPAKTLKAGVNGVPGGENMMIRDDGTVRYLTIRECARVQTFPDNYIFHEVWGRAVRQLGNAVPVRLANIIGISLKASLASRNSSK